MFEVDETDFVEWENGMGFTAHGWTEDGRTHIISSPDPARLCRCTVCEEYRTQPAIYQESDI